MESLSETNLFQQDIPSFIAYVNNKNSNQHPPLHYTYKNEMLNFIIVQLHFWSCPFAWSIFPLSYL